MADITVNVMPISAQFLVTETGEENTYQFTATPVPACDPEESCFYFWEFGDGDVSYDANPIHAYDGLGSYTVYFTVANEIGCSDTQPYTILGPPAIWIPNSFTPNGDGINDVFQVVSHDLLEYEIKIFNRWGEMVFQSTDPAMPWMGNHKSGEYFCPDGVYQYVARIKGFNTDAVEYSGTISLLR
jgi:gliding motility-associated-like protein